MMKLALGSTELQVSSLGLGCNNFGGRLDPERTRLVVDAAIAAGITFIDTADTYGNRGGSERLLGETLGNRRKDVVLATKFGLPMDEAGRLKGASRAYVMTAVGRHRVQFRPLPGALRDLCSVGAALRQYRG